MLQRVLVQLALDRSRQVDLRMVGSLLGLLHYRDKDRIDREVLLRLKAQP